MRITDKGSSQRTITRDGYLVVPATISKIGVFDYHASELGLSDGKIKKVARTENALFSDRTLKSFDGVPITIGHPEQGVNAKNWKQLAVGTVRNVKRENDSLIAEACIYDEGAIALIQEKGIKELSCGYDCDVIATELANADFEMSPMIGNHVAIVANGRCGSSVKLADGENFMNKNRKFLDAFLGAFGIKLTDEQAKKVEDDEKEQDAKKSESTSSNKSETKSEKTDDTKEKEQKMADADLLKRIADLEAENKQLKDAKADTESEQKRTTLLADGATVREIQESAVIAMDIFAKDEAAKLSD